MTTERRSLPSPGRCVRRESVPHVAALPGLPAGRFPFESMEQTDMRIVLSMLACVVSLVFAPFIDFLPPPGGKGE